MRMLRKTLFFVASGSLALGACGDDSGDGNNNDPDAAPVVDAGEPDAAGPADFAGTLNLADITVLAPGTPLNGLSGGVASISFSDPEVEGVAPEPGFESPISGCQITLYEVGEDVDPDGVDAGPISVTGSNAPDFTCAFDDGQKGYLCSFDDAASAGTIPMTGSGAAPIGEGAVAVTIAGADFSGANYAGTSVILTGFSPPEANGRFPVLQDGDGGGTLVVFNPALAGPATLAADGAYQTLIGTGPAPGGFDLLDDEGAAVTLTKAAVDRSGAISQVIPAGGGGMVLAEGEGLSLPNAIPLDGSEMKFSCDGEGGAEDTCGVKEGIVQGMVIFGETTDADVSGLAPNAMPDAVSNYATFRCAFIGMKSATVPAAGMALIMGTNPTRIQTTVTYASGAIAGGNNMLMSHGYVGFTTVPAEEL